MTYEKEERKDKDEKGKNRRFQLPPLSSITPPESAKDPIMVLREIARDDEIDADTKSWLFKHSIDRFKNRRKMAYSALYTIIGIVVFLLLASLIDGLRECTGEACGPGILDKINEVGDVLVWIVGFLASIVAAYYGSASLRPSS